MPEPRFIDVAAVARSLHKLAIGWEYKQETASTNADVLASHAEQGRELVVVSEGQSAGRGRRGRTWVSPFARNIYCSIGLVRTLPASCLGLVPILTGVALCHALRDQGFAGVQLKWPNDLLCDGRKLGGILIESRSLQHGDYLFAIGFGINVEMDAEELAAIERPATSLVQLAGKSVERTPVLIAALQSVIAAVRGFEASASDALIETFSSLDAYHDREIEVVAAGASIRGINRGLTAEGQLRLDTGAGIALYSAAEISLRVPGA